MESYPIEALMSSRGLPSMLLPAVIMTAAALVIIACGIRLMFIAHRSASAYAPGPGSNASAQMAAFDREIIESQAYVRAVLRARGIPKQECPDVLQRVIVEALQAIKAGRYEQREGVPLRAWLAQIARHIAAKYLRARGREEPCDPRAMEFNCTELAPDVSVEGKETWSNVKEDLATDPHGSIVIDHDLDGLPMEAVAQGLGVPTSTAYRWRAAVLDRLRSAARRRETY